MSGKTDYAGIDYAGFDGKVNRGPDGIRYGIISAHALTPYLYDALESDYGPPHCPKCGCEAEEGESHSRESNGYVTTWTEHPEHTENWECSGCGDYRCDNCEYLFDGDEAFGYEPVSQTFDDSECAGFLDSHGDVWVTRSSYYTRAQFCNPCAPGAGHLNNPCPSGPRVYCFPHSWFESGKAPYPVFSIKTGKRVHADGSESNVIDRN